MSACFILLKAAGWFACPYDWPIFLVLLGLDAIWTGSWLRLWVYRHRR